VSAFILIQHTKVSQYSTLLKATIWTDDGRITIKLKEDEIWMTDPLK